jgi:hypothetical protein
MLFSRLSVPEQRHQHHQQKNAHAQPLGQWKAGRILENIRYYDDYGNRSDGNDKYLDGSITILVHVPIT